MLFARFLLYFNLKYILKFCADRYEKKTINPNILFFNKPAQQDAIIDYSDYINHPPWGPSEAPKAWPGQGGISKLTFPLTRQSVTLEMGAMDVQVERILFFKCCQNTASVFMYRQLTEQKGRLSAEFYTFKNRCYILEQF